MPVKRSLSLSVCQPQPLEKFNLVNIGIFEQHGSTPMEVWKLISPVGWDTAGAFLFYMVFFMLLDRTYFEKRRTCMRCRKCEDRLASAKSFLFGCKRLFRQVCCDEHNHRRARTSVMMHSHWKSLSNSSKSGLCCTVACSLAGHVTLYLVSRQKQARARCFC